SRELVWPALVGALAALGATPTVMVMPLTGVIGPASSDFVERGLARAAADGAQLAVLQIDTPGGLDTDRHAGWVSPRRGVSGPASSDFVERGLARAAADGAQLAVLQIDTPGGLD